MDTSIYGNIVTGPVIDSEAVLSTVGSPTSRPGNVSSGFDQNEKGAYCHYRNCRHRHGQHGKSWTVNGKQIQCKCKHFVPAGDSEFKGRILDSKDIEFKCLTEVLGAVETFCDCGEPRRPFDVEQDFRDSVDGKREVITYHHCPKCKYDMSAWKIERKITQEQRAFLESKGVKLVWRQVGT